MDYSKHQFEKLFKENYQMMYRMAYSVLQDEENAKDAVNQVFAKMWHKKPQIKDGTQTGYLLAAARNQALHALQKRKRQQEFEREFSANDNEQENAHQQELMAELLKVIENNLTEQDRRILSLHYDEDMTYAETAQVLGISPSTVNKHITRSLAKIRNIFKNSKHYED